MGGYASLRGACSLQAVVIRRWTLLRGFARNGVQRFACRRCCLVLRLRQGNIAYTLLAAGSYILFSNKSFAKLATFSFLLLIT